MGSKVQQLCGISKLITESLSIFNEGDQHSSGISLLLANASPVALGLLLYLSGYGSWDNIITLRLFKGQRLKALNTSFLYGKTENLYCIDSNLKSKR